ncbi:MAG: molybdopterin-dependent oxidoreductase [Acidocella sp.]|nr:molybdopterin-dependent oxidoreductase [Acidocella sp.]
MVAFNQLMLSRRRALCTGGALFVSFATSACSSSETTAATGMGSATKPALTPPELDSWIAVKQDNSVVGYFGKVDVGLGIQVAIAQIIADELDVGFDQVSVVMGDTAFTVNQGGASGSTGLELGSVSVRNAAAQARAQLLAMAAAKFGAPASRLTVNDGIVSLADEPGKTISYGDLIGGRYFDYELTWNHKIGNELLVEGTAPLKNHADYRVVGKSIPRADIADKLFGNEVFNTDVRVPGMLHGRMVRPPVAGAIVVKVHPESVQLLPDVQLVVHNNLVGVVAAKEWTAIQAAKLLKIDWSTPKPAFPAEADLYKTIESAKTVGKGGPKPTGDTKATMAAASKTIEATYLWPFQSHASMGPACAIVDVQPDHVTIWTGDQKPHYVRDGVAALLGVPAAKVHAIWLRGPGSYGRNDGGDSAMDAAVLSKAVGKPVRVQYMRIDATAWDPKGPASVHKTSAGIDANGKVVAYHYRSIAFSRENIASHPDDPTQSLAGQFMGMPVSSKQAFDVPDETYDFGVQHLDWEVVPALLDRASPLRTSHLRDPLGPQINFASECFMDELALATNMDPVAFRLKYLKDKRGTVVIEAAAKAANWQPQMGHPGKPQGVLLKGRGMAFARRKDTRVAVIVDVEVDRHTGRVWPRHWFVAHDCGLIVNPNTLRRVIEGNIVHATSRALFEEVAFNPHMVTSVDWLSYPILDIKDAPESINITLINHKDDLPLGAGEPSSRPVASAIANAVFNATGIRFRQAPLTKARVKAAFI